MNRPALGILVALVTILVAGVTFGATLADTASYDDSGVSTTAGDVELNPGSIFGPGPATNFVAIFSDPNIGGASFEGELSFQFDTALAGSVELIAWEATSGTISASTFTSGGFDNATITNLGTFTASGSHTVSNIDVSIFSAADDFIGFEFRSTVADSATHHISILPAELTLTVAIPNSPPVAVASNVGDSSYDASDLTPKTVSGAGSSDPDSDPLSYTWTPGGTTPSGVTTDISFLEAVGAGLAHPYAAATINLDVSDGIAPPESDSVMLTYDDAPTTATISSPDGGLTINATINDADLAVADATPGFSEDIIAIFSDNLFGPLGPLELIDSESNNDISVSLSQAQLDAILADDGIIQLELENNNAPAGQTFQSIDINLADFQVIPEPASIALWSMLGLCLSGYFWRRKRAA